MQRDLKPHKGTDFELKIGFNDLKPLTLIESGSKLQECNLSMIQDQVVEVGHGSIIVFVFPVFIFFWKRLVSVFWARCQYD